MKNICIEKLIHHFGLDHLEVFATFKDETIFEKLDFDNSNYSELDEYTVTKHEVYKYRYKIVFTRWDYTLFAYYKGIPSTAKQPIPTKDYVAVYSTAFKLLEYEEVLGFIEWYSDPSHCRRFDICIDLKIWTDDLLNNHFDTYKTGRDYRKSWKTETRYFWEMQSSKNKRQLIRVYNKNLDIVTKGKIKLYQEYLTYPHMTRVELEIRQELAKVTNYQEVFNDDLLIGIFKNYLHKYTEIFDDIEGERITLFRSKDLKIPEDDYQSLYYKTQNYKTFIWWARKIYNIWFCPVRVLIGEWYIHDKTKLALWIDTLHELIVKERDVKSQARHGYYQREDRKAVIDNLYKHGKV